MNEKQNRKILRNSNLWIVFPVLIIVLLAGILWSLVRQDDLERQSVQQQHTTTLLTAHTRDQETLLMNYMNTISDLMVSDKLLTASTMAPATVDAEAQTQIVLRELDANHKGILMRFLYQTRLINNDYHSISMANADLRGAHLASLDLRDTDLTGADLTDADLRGVNLSYATLSYVNVTGANLTGANLYGSELHNITVMGATMAGVYMKDAFNLGNTSFTQAKSLSGATMPDGTKHS